MSSFSLWSRRPVTVLSARYFSSASRPAAAATTVYRPRRALLYMPGSSSKMLTKAQTLDVDTVCMDLEDAVAGNKKGEARANIVHALNTWQGNIQRTERLVRINPVGSGFEQEDINQIFTAQNLPDGIVLPKVENLHHLHWLDEQMHSKLGARGKEMKIIALIESTSGLLNIAEIKKASKRLVAFIFGADDYAASVGAIRTRSNAEVSFARNTVLLHAKSAGLQAIDLVNINFHDEDVLVKECLEGFQLGYTGKQIIHPKQIVPVQKSFSPSEQIIQWAQKVVTAAEQHDADGKGAFTLDNQMIDMPTIKQAQQVLQLAKSCGLVH